MAETESRSAASGRNWVADLGNFLVKEKVITQAELSNILALYSQIDIRISHLAALKGYITPRDVFRILTSQMGQDGRFGNLEWRQQIGLRVEIREGEATQASSQR